MTQEERIRAEEPPVREPHRVRLPGFLIEEDVGLGDAIKKVTYSMGIAPCGGWNVALGRSIDGCVLRGEVRGRDPREVAMAVGSCKRIDGSSRGRPQQ